MILRLAALASFLVVVILAWIDDTPDPIQMLGGLALGCAFWVAAELAGDRIR